MLLLTCWCMPSAISNTPITTRKLSASICRLGCLLMMRLTGPANSIMIPMATTTAIIMISTLSTKPTAVSMESNENTISIKMIWIITLISILAPTATAFTSWCSCNCILECISSVLLMIRKSPPTMRIMSFQENFIGPSVSGSPNQSSVSTGSFRPMIQLIINNNATLNNMAKSRPIFLAFFCWLSGSLLERIDIKMMLSTPSTISRKARVSRLIQIPGSAKFGMCRLENKSMNSMVVVLVVMLFE